VNPICPRCGFDPALPSVACPPPAVRPSGLGVPAWVLSRGGVLVPEDQLAELEAPAASILEAAPLGPIVFFPDLSAVVASPAISAVSCKGKGAW
jgi:hypothetical protein